MIAENFWMYFVAALIPMIVGALYYHPKAFGTSWMNVNGFTEETMKKGNMAVIFGVSYLFSLFIALTMAGISIHQGGVAQMMMPDIAESGSQAQTQFNDLMNQYGTRFRSFKHGALHGVFFAIFLVLPLIGTNALFERRGWKYIFIHTGYWAISMALMAGLLCATLQWGPMQ
jgi:hypothetical protein